MSFLSNGEAQPSADAGNAQAAGIGQHDPTPFLVRMFRALRHRNYRLFFIGQLISLIGTWITNVASGWLVYRLTKSELFLGLVSFANQFPSFLIAPFAGVLVDRWNRRRVLMWTQAASCLQSALLAVLTLSAAIDIYTLIILGMLQAVINAFDMPARHAFVSEMVPSRADLSNAIALNSAMFNGARLIGPAIGGVLITLWGEGVCFLIDAMSFCAVLAMLALVRVPVRSAGAANRGVFSGLLEGAVYAFRVPIIRDLLVVVALVSFFVSPHLVLMPVFAREILRGGPGLLGFLMGASGCGALLGALSLAARHSTRGLGELIFACGLLLGFALIGFSYCTVVWLSLPLVFVMGTSFISLLAASNTIIQSSLDDTKRARVMSFYMMAFIGMMPLGGFSAGLLASYAGTPQTVALGGILCLLGTLLFGRRLSHLRHIINAPS